MAAGQGLLTETIKPLKIGYKTGSDELLQHVQPVTGPVFNADGAHVQNSKYGRTEGRERKGGTGGGVWPRLNKPAADQSLVQV